MSGAWQTPSSGTTYMAEPETVGIRVTAEEKETIVKQNSETAQIEHKTHGKTFKFSVVGLLALIPKAYFA